MSIGTNISLTSSRTLTTEETKERIVIQVSQNNHGFQTGQVVRNTGSVWTKASADSADTAEVFGMVERLGPNDFNVVMRGRIRGMNGLQAGEVYYLSTVTAGAITVDAPSTAGLVSKPVLFALSSTDAIVLDSRGIEITDGTIAANTVGYNPTAPTNFANPTPSLVSAALDQLSDYIIPVGTPLPWFSNSLPSYGNWLWLNGQEISRVTYSKLFGVYGTAFGSGDGVLSFNVPDMRGRTIFGKANIGGIDTNQPAGIDTTKTTIGAAGGEHEHTLTINEIPSHSHTYNEAINTVTAGTGGDAARNDEFQTTTTGVTGGGQAHNNMPPFIYGAWITRYA